MNCPYCGKPMEAGFLASNRVSGIPWLPEGTEMPWFSLQGEFSIYKRGGFLLADQASARNGLTLTAWLCRDCGKGIFNIADDRTVFDKEPEK